MKIAIDIQTTLGQKSGFGFYVKNLVESLKTVSPENEYISIAPQNEKDLSTPQRLIWDQWTFPLKAARAKVDILHQPCFSAPLFYSGKIVITIHDLISLFFPRNLPRGSRFYFSQWMPLTYHKASKIIAISENTKKDIISLLKIPEEKIKVIHSAAAEKFKLILDSKKTNAIKEKYQTGPRFILDSCTIEPRKNLLFLVKAFNLAIRKGKISHNLVIAGKKGWYYEDLFALVEELNLQNRVIFTGNVPEDDLPALYNAADLFVFPSLYEGFGFTPLEAMACGTPVIAAKNSSIPEVVGDGGILLNIKDEKEWADKIIRVLANKTLWTKLRIRGLARAKQFSWEKTARETIKVYEEVYKN